MRQQFPLILILMADDFCDLGSFGDLATSTTTFSKTSMSFVSSSLTTGISLLSLSDKSAVVGDLDVDCAPRTALLGHFALRAPFGFSSLSSTLVYDQSTVSLRLCVPAVCCVICAAVARSLMFDGRWTHRLPLSSVGIVLLTLFEP